MLESSLYHSFGVRLGEAPHLSSRVLPPASDAHFHLEQQQRAQVHVGGDDAEEQDDQVRVVEQVLVEGVRSLEDEDDADAAEGAEGERDERADAAPPDHRDVDPQLLVLLLQLTRRPSVLQEGEDGQQDEQEVVAAHDGQGQDAGQVGDGRRRADAAVPRTRVPPGGHHDDGGRDAGGHHEVDGVLADLPHEGAGEVPHVGALVERSLAPPQHAQGQLEGD